MGNHGFTGKQIIALIAIVAYVVFSLITHLALTLIDIHSLKGAFAITAIWMGGFGLLMWKDMR